MKVEKSANSSFYDQEPETIIIYRNYFKRLLSVSKPLRDQLLIEFPTLEGLRTKEVSTLRVEYFDFENGDMLVLDSKKHRHTTIPLRPDVAQHTEKYIAENGLTEGVLLQRRPSGPKRKPGNGLSNYAIECVWKRWCEAADIPYMPPRYGRAYFAADLHVRGMSMIGLMHILRHDSLLTTQKYISRIYFYEDVKIEFHKGQRTPFVSECVRSDKCPIACEGCRCKMFQPSLEAVVVQNSAITLETVNMPFMVNEEPLYGLTLPRQERRQKWMRSKRRGRKF